MLVHEEAISKSKKVEKPDLQQGQRSEFEEAPETIEKNFSSEHIRKRVQVKGGKKAPVAAAFREPQTTLSQRDRSTGCSRTMASTLGQIYNSSPRRWRLVVMVTVILVALVGFLANYSDFAEAILKGGRTTPVDTVHISGNIEYDLALPDILLNKGIYNGTDFVNEAGVIPAYWGSQENETDHRRRYGPCFAYRYSEDVDWEAEIEEYQQKGKTKFNDKMIHTDQFKDVHGYCRPGFIIIGAGKKSLPWTTALWIHVDCNQADYGHR